MHFYKIPNNKFQIIYTPPAGGVYSPFEPQASVVLHKKTTEMLDSQMQDVRLPDRNPSPGATEAATAVRAARAPTQAQREGTSVGAVVPIRTAKEDTGSLIDAGAIGVHLSHAIGGIP